MSNLPLHSNNSSVARRRHQHQVDIFSTAAAESSQQSPSSELSSVDVASSRLASRLRADNQHTNANLDDKYLKPHLVQQQHHNNNLQSSSFANLSTLIAPASQIWNTAQNSIQSFAEQYTQHFDQYYQTDSSLAPNRTPSRTDSESDLFNPQSLPVEMPFRDRTAEFRTVIKSCQLRFQPNGHLQQVKSERDRLIQSSIQFNQLARRIGRDLSMTCAKMEKLAQLAKKKSLFDDRSGEVEELSQIIKQDITGLNKQIANLQQVATQRTGAAASTVSEKQGQDHSKLVVVGLQSKLANISKSFQNALEIRTQNLKLKRNRREKFSQSAAIPSNLPPSASAGNLGSILLQDDAAAASGSSSVALDMDQLEQHRVQDQALLIDESETYHQSRFNMVENIQSSISELGSIWQQLATMVAEQGEMVNRIDSNVEETAMNVDSAHYELLKYLNNISKNRWLILKVFGFLMAFFVFFVIFMT